MCVYIYIYIYTYLKSSFFLVLIVLEVLLYAQFKSTWHLIASKFDDLASRRRRCAQKRTAGWLRA